MTFGPHSSLSAAASYPQGHNTSGPMTLRRVAENSVVCFNITAAFVSTLPRKRKYYIKSQNFPEFFIQVTF
jgi:hypothetical protein